MQRIQTRLVNGRVRAGLADHETGFRHVSHTGGMPGVTSVLSLLPNERLVFVVLNTRNAAVV